MEYNPPQGQAVPDAHQAQPYDPSQPHHAYYDPYSYHHHYDASGSASYYQPPPPGTDPAPPHSAASSDAPAYYAHEGLNPAAASAVAALSQLTDFAASMGAAERAMGQPVYLPQYPPAPHPPVIRGRGAFRGGKRGGWPPRGGGSGRGNVAHPPPQQDIGVTPSRGSGRGRGRGRGRKGSGRQIMYAPAGSSMAEAQLGPSQLLAQIQDVGQVTASNVARRPALPAAWCDICRVECNSMEILEQHKNGKRHKRTAQRMQEIEAQQKMMDGSQAMVPVNPGAPPSQVGGLPHASAQLAQGRGPFTALHMVQPVSSSDHGTEEHREFLTPEIATAAVAQVQVSEATTGSSAEGNTASLTMAVDASVEAPVQLHAAGVQARPENEMKEGGGLPPSSATGSHVPPRNQGVGARVDGNGRYDWRNSMKRKMISNGRGGKKLRTFGTTTARGKPERVREQPIVCTICNVTCDTKAVFDIHTGGKKHTSRLKRFQGPDTEFGPIVVYIPPNQPVAHPVGAPEPLFYGLKTRQMVEQAAYLNGGMQPEAPMLQTDHQSGMVAKCSQGTTDVTHIEQVRSIESTTAPSSAAAAEADAKEAPPAP